MPGEEVVAAVRTSAAGWQTDRGSTEELLRSWQEVRRQTTHQIGTTWPSVLSRLRFAEKRAQSIGYSRGAGHHCAPRAFHSRSAKQPLSKPSETLTAVSAISATIPAISAISAIS